MAVLRDPRFHDPSLRRFVLTSVHTPASDKVKVRQEANLLIRHLPSEAATRVGTGRDTAVPFTDQGAAEARANFGNCVTFILAGDFNLHLTNDEDIKPALGRGHTRRANTFRENLDVDVAAGLVETTTSKWRIVYGAGPGTVTSGGGSCHDQFLINPDAEAKGRLRAIQEPIHLRNSKKKNPGKDDAGEAKGKEWGLSDHDPVVLELRESRVYKDVGRVGARDA